MIARSFSPGMIDRCAKAPEIDVISFGPGADPVTFQRQSIASIDDLLPLPPRHTIRWIHVSGLDDADALNAIGRRFKIHPLALEDIASTTQRPKVEPYSDYLFIVTRVPDDDASHPAPGGIGAPRSDSCGAPLVTRQLSICLGRDFVLSFLESAQNVVGHVRHRLTSGSSGMNAHGADYLAYAILDAAIDAFFPLLEVYGEHLETLEADVIARPAVNQIARIHDLKRNLLTARRAVWPQREMLNAIAREETPFVSADTKLFLRDCYDHTIQLIDMIETDREIASGLVDIQLSSQNNRMNEIMKVLTVIATIFIPLTFIAGVYGMNFDTASPWNLPELKWRYGYPAVLVLMLAIAGGLLLWFRRKGWIGRPKA